MQLLEKATAGSLESNDTLITITPSSAGAGITVNLTSPVKVQFGKRIIEVILETMSLFGVEDAQVDVTDNGALDWTLRARVETAIRRSGGERG